MKAVIPSFTSFMKTALSVGLALASLIALAACTGAEAEPVGDYVGFEASIGNACGPADGREVWIRVAERAPEDTLPIHACPAFIDGGLRIVLLNDGRGLEDLKADSYPMRWAWECGPGADTGCQERRATVTITQINDTEVFGTFTLLDTLGTQSQSLRHFRAARCVLSPQCG